MDRTSLTPAAMALFSARLPLINEWISETVAAHWRESRLLAEMDFKHIPRFLTDETLSNMRLVVTDAPPRPPMRKFGLMGIDQQLDGMATDWEMRGATIDQLSFIGSGYVHDEQFPFHQIIHALQWRHQGRKTWLTNYAFGVFTCGRADTWAEKQAGRLQSAFAKITRTSNEVFSAEQLVTTELRALAQRRGFPFV
jgi:hypothetical protein